MKKIILVFVIAFITNSSVLKAQGFSTDVPFHMPFDSSYVVGQGMTDSFDISNNQGYVSGQFVLCHNAVFTFKGNQSSSGPSFYLFPGATLILQDSYFYPTIYLSSMSNLDAKGGSQNMICYRESSATLADTSNVNWLTDSIVSSMNFTFSTWPNASSPCAISPPQGVNDFDDLLVNLSVQNRTLNYRLNNEQASRMLLFDLQGRRLAHKKFSVSGRFDVSHLASGIYIVHIAQKGKILKKKIWLD